MQINVVDPADSRALGEINELERACYRADGRRRPPPALAETVIDWTVGEPASEVVPLQARLDDRLAGCALAQLPGRDNTGNAFVSVSVHPDLRRRGIGTALTAEILAHVRERGRNVVIGRAVAGGPGMCFAPAVGGTRQQDALFNVLDLEQLDRPALAAGLAAAGRRAAGYVLTRVTGPAPPELLPALVAMYEVMNDAPRESEAFELESWPPERVMQEDQWRAERGQLAYSLLAFARDSGQVAGMTRIVVKTDSDQAAQLDTAVAPQHRGHRLGYLLKASMLEWLRAAEPRLRSVGTANAADNEHMLAINTELGFAAAERWTYFQRALCRC